MFNWFKKETCFCNEHSDLKRLQELNQQLKNLQIKKENLNLFFPNLNDKKYSPMFNYKISKSVEDAIILGKYLTDAILSNGFVNVEKFIDNIKPHLPDNDVKYLKDMGNFLIVVSEGCEEINTIKDEIKKIKQEIQVLKDKLEIQ